MDIILPGQDGKVLRGPQTNSPDRKLSFLLSVVPDSPSISVKYTSKKYTFNEKAKLISYQIYVLLLTLILFLLHPKHEVGLLLVLSCQPDCFESDYCLQTRKIEILFKASVVICSYLNLLTQIHMSQHNILSQNIEFSHIN